VCEHCRRHGHGVCLSGLPANRGTFLVDGTEIVYKSRMAEKGNAFADILIASSAIFFASGRGLFSHSVGSSVDRWRALSLTVGSKDETRGLSDDPASNS
jgi:hypothetical protein